MTNLTLYELSQEESNLLLATKVNTETRLTFITLNYHILTTFHTAFKLNFGNSAKNFARKISKLN